MLTGISVITATSTDMVLLSIISTVVIIITNTIENRTKRWAPA